MLTSNPKTKIPSPRASTESLERQCLGLGATIVGLLRALTLPLRRITEARQPSVSALPSKSSRAGRATTLGSRDRKRLQSCLKRSARDLINPPRSAPVRPVVIAIALTAAATALVTAESYAKLELSATELMMYGKSIDRMQAAVFAVDDPSFQTKRALQNWAMVQNPKLSLAQSSVIVDSIFDFSIKRGLDPFLFFALVQVESKFDPLAVSPVGALGLSQVMRVSHPDKVKSNAALLDPVFNLDVGTAILAEYLAKYNGDLEKALLQYNGSLHLGTNKYAVQVRQKRLEILNHIRLSTS